MTRSRVVALVLVLVAGTAGGVTTALVTATDQPSDPLGIGIPQVDLRCTGEPVLVVETGDSAAALRPAVANNPPDEELHYLDTRTSCDARWTPETSTAEPRWVVYAGPGDRQVLCEDRMTAAHRGDNVTFLIDGSPRRADCLCEVSLDEAPVLRPGMSLDAGEVIWVRALQDMFATIDAERTRPEPTALTEDDVTGSYDRRTIARVRALEEANAAPTDGVVDGDLWNTLVRSGCRLVEPYS